MVDDIGYEDLPDDDLVEKHRRVFVEKFGRAPRGPEIAGVVKAARDEQSAGAAASRTGASVGSNSQAKGGVQGR